MVGVFVTVNVRVGVGVLVTVRVGVNVGKVPVGVAVGVLLGPQPTKANWISVLGGAPVLHSNCVKRKNVSSCEPMVALMPPSSRMPSTMSKSRVASYNLTSKLARCVVFPNKTVRHSMLNIRLGAVPLTEVNMPHPVP